MIRFGDGRSLACFVLGDTNVHCYFLLLELEKRNGFSNVENNRSVIMKFLLPMNIIYSILFYACLLAY